jgi:hypothetical protein
MRIPSAGPSSATMDGGRCPSSHSCQGIPRKETGCALRCVARSASITPIMQRASTVWGTRGAVTGGRLGSQGVTIVDALTTGRCKTQRLRARRTDLGWRGLEGVCRRASGRLAEVSRSTTSLQISGGPQGSRTPDLRRARACWATARRLVGTASAARRVAHGMSVVARVTARGAPSAAPRFARLSAPKPSPGDRPARPPRRAASATRATSRASCRCRSRSW